jgi:hypothetical protein
MRRAVCVAVAVMMAALLSSPAFAASDSDVATASVTVEEVVDVALTWQTTGTSHIDLGPIAPGELPTPTEILIMDVAHNLVGNPQYSVQAEVDKTSGPDWVGSIDLYLVLSRWYGTRQTSGHPRPSATQLVRRGPSRSYSLWTFGWPRVSRRLHTTLSLRLH